MRLRTKLCRVALGLALAPALAGCRQPANDVCQNNDDCESPLVCNAGTGRCQRSGAANMADAAPQADAALAPDGGPDAGDAVDAAAVAPAR